MSLTACLLTVAPASAEVVQRGGVRVAVGASLAPKALPRRGSAPVAVSLSGRISPVEVGSLPQLEDVAIAINSHGALSTSAVPPCPLGAIEASTNAGALSACRRSLVGEGHFSADVRLPEQSPFPSSGRLLAFNGRYRGKPAILAHIYGVEPFPTTYVLPFLIEQRSGTYGTVLSASLPRVTGQWGFVTGISLTLGTQGQPGKGVTSFLAAGCPAPEGFPGAVYPLAKTTFSFTGGPNLTSVVSRSCKAL